MRWFRALLAGPLLIGSCRTPPTPTPEPVLPPPPPVVVEPLLPPVSHVLELDPDAGSLASLRRELIFDGGLPLADAQTFPEPYSEHEGVFTFRGGPRRTGGAWGVIPKEPHELSVAWVVATEQSKAPWFGGSGWTGQPAIVRWPAVVRHSMTKLGALRQRDDFVEVIQGSLDGNVHFIDLATGLRSRPMLHTGNPIKGSVSLDPRGYPLLFVGQGIPENRPIGLRVFELINDSEVFFLPGSDRAAPRGWGAFDSSGLLNRATDTYVVGGENGLLYLLRLHTNFDPLALTLKVAPEVARYRYKSPGNEYFGIENSLSVLMNLAFFADNGGTLQAVDLRTMTPRWKFEAGDDTDATLALDLEPSGPKLYTGTEVDKTGPKGKTWLRRLDGLTGKPEWQKGYACQGATGPPKKIDAGVFATPTVGSGEVSDLVFFVLARCPGPDNGVMVALSKKTGDEVWRYEFPLFSWSTPTLLTDEDGHAYLLHGGIGGVVRLLEARSGLEVARLQLEGDIESSPAVFGSRAVLGTRANRIYGIDIR